MTSYRFAFHCGQHTQWDAGSESYPFSLNMFNRFARKLCLSVIYFGLSFFTISTVRLSVSFPVIYFCLSFFTISSVCLSVSLSVISFCQRRLSKSVAGNNLSHCFYLCSPKICFVLRKALNSNFTGSRCAVKLQK